MTHPRAKPTAQLPRNQIEPWAAIAEHYAQRTGGSPPDIAALMLAAVDAGLVLCLDPALARRKRPTPKETQPHD